jgi:hypothetical protein
MGNSTAINYRHTLEKAFFQRMNKKNAWDLHRKNSQVSCGNRIP